jgi:hypothetical protein
MVSIGCLSVELSTLRERLYTLAVGCQAGGFQQGRHISADSARRLVSHGFTTGDSGEPVPDPVAPHTARHHVTDTPFGWVVVTASSTRCNG